MRIEQMNVMILGYGAREHALAWKIAQSPRVAEVFVAPGNAGTAQIATNVPINDEDVPSLTQFALDNEIDLTVVGTNDPLAFGVVDAFQAAGLAIFGPQMAAAQLESSKAFAKGFMHRHAIPTAHYATFTNYDEAMAYVEQLATGRVVVKISGLGKMGMGVTVCDTKGQAKAALKTYMIDRLLGDSADTVIIEERLEGDELSFFAVCDGKTAVPLIPVRDHKRIYDGDSGPNTGGMAAYGPPPDVDIALTEEIMQTVIQPTVEGMAAEGTPYVGVLFAGLMITTDGLRVLEFNCRFGNPEALVLMLLLKSDLVEVMLACIHGRLTPEDVVMRRGAAAAVVVSSPQYPAEVFPLGLPISGIRKVGGLDTVEVFHHGTARQNGRFITARGRVLAVAAQGNDLESALEQTYAGVEQIEFDGAHYRTDVGRGFVALERPFELLPIAEIGNTFPQTRVI